MKKDILYEVYRIQELIGIQKNIIKENKYVEFLSDMIKDFIAVSKKTIPNVTDEVMVGTIQVEKRILDEIIDVLDDPQLYEYLSNVEKTIFARIAAQSPEIVDDIYKRVFTEFVNNTDNVTEKSLINKIAKEYNDGKQISQIIKEMSGSDDPFVPTLLTKKIFGKVNDLKLNKFVEEVKPKPKVGDDISKVIKKIAKDPKTIDLTGVQNINWINRFLSSRKSVFNVVRRSANSALLRYEKKLLGNEEFIQRTFQDILQTINKINSQLKGDISKIDNNKILTELRSAASKIKVIQDTYKTDIDALYKEIEESLSENVTDTKTKELLPEFMKKLKEVDPFALGSWEQKSYALKFLNTTATQQTINNIGRIFKNTVLLKKEVWVEIKQLLSRVPAFLLTGAPKTIGDMQSYFVKYGDVRGIGELTKDIWLASHIGLPLSLAAVDTIYNLILLSFTPISGVPRETIWNDYVTNLEDDFFNQYKGMTGFYDNDKMNLLTIAYGLLSPGHFIAKDVWSWIAEIGGKIETEQMRPTTEIPKQLQDVFDKYKIPKSTQDSMLNAIKNAPTAEEAKKMVEDFAKRNIEPVVAPVVDKDIKRFKDFIKTSWGTDYNDTDKFTKEGDIYVVDVKGVGRFIYKYDGTTFIKPTTN
jgi:transcriptional regulator NrdR family protein